MTAYATHTDVEAYLNKTLTAPQQAQADFYASAASAFIDIYTGKSWAPSNPFTEKRLIQGPLLYLENKPIIAITSININGGQPGAEDTLLESNVDYRLLDASKGLISLGYFGDYEYEYNLVPYLDYYATIVYTHSITCPDNIKLATIVMAAGRMNATLNPMQQRVRSLNDNRAVSITFRDTDDAVKDALYLLPSKKVHIS